MSAPQSTAPKTNEEKTLVLTGNLGEFNVGGNTKNRQYFLTNVPLRDFRKFFKIDVYDPTKGKGEQRGNILAWSKKLHKAMNAGDYTPACLSVGIREAHLKNLMVDTKKRKVTITVYANNKLPVIDGGHRSVSFELLRDGQPNEEQKKLIDSIDVPLQIYLNPDLVADDFQNLNDGKRVSRSQMKMMKEAKMLADPNIDAKVSVPIAVARRIAGLLDTAPDSESFLSNDINFVGGGNGKTDYSSVTGVNGSDIATSIAGGVKIVTYESYKEFFPTGEEYIKKTADFLFECYKSVWMGIFKYDEKEEVTNQLTGKVDSFPQLLIDGNMLRPNRLGGKGTKTGTGFLVMAGNMLAFRMLRYTKKTVIKPEYVKHVVSTLRETLLGELQGGGSGTARREATGEFIREYFKDAVRKTEDDQQSLHKMGSVDGVPIELCDYILTPSTCNVQSKAERTKAAKEKDYSPNRLSDPNQTMEGFDEDAAVGELQEDEDENTSINVDGGSDLEMIDESPIVEADDDETEDFHPEPAPKNGKKKSANVGLTG